MGKNGAVEKLPTGKMDKKNINLNSMRNMI